MTRNCRAWHTLIYWLVGTGLFFLRPGVARGQAELRDLVDGGAPAPTLVSNLTQLRHLTRLQARSNPPVRLRGQVTHYDSQWGALYLADGAGTAYVGVTNRSLAFSPGSWVEVEGLALPGLTPQIGSARLVQVGPGILPAASLVSLDDLIGPRWDCQRVVVHSVIRSMHKEYDRLMIDFGEGGGRFRAHLPNFPGTVLPTNLLHARVSLTGVVGGFFNPQDQSTGVRLYLNALSDVHVLESGPSDRFAEPAVTPSSISLAPPSLSGLTKLRGVVTLAAGGGRICIQDGTNGVWIRALPASTPVDTNGLYLPASVPPGLRPGDLVEAVGYQKLTGYGVLLADAEVRVVGTAGLPPPADISCATALAGTYHARRIRMAAQLVSRAPRLADGAKLVVLTLEENGQYFDAICPEARGLLALPLGSQIRVTGICDVETDHEDRRRTFRVLSEDAAAVELVKSPPWWRPERIVAAGVGLMLLAGAWTVRVRHRMNLRRMELQRREEAAAAVRQTNVQLESRVAERTRELQQSNADLQAEIEERRRSQLVQQVCYKISEAVHTVTDLSKFYLRIHELVEELMPAKNIFLLLENPGTGHHEYVYHVDERDPWPEPHNVTQGLVGYILRTGNSLLVDRDSMMNPDHEWRFVSGTASEVWLGVPLVTNGRVIGVMALQDYRNRHAYGEKDREVLTYVAAQTAVAIEWQRARGEIERGEARLRASEQRFRRVFETSPALMILTRLQDGRVETVNESFLKTTGYGRDEVLGRLAADLNLYAVDEQRLEFRQMLQRDGVVHNREHMVRTKTGALKTVLISAEVTRMDGELHVLTVGQDISARKQAELDMQRALAQERDLQEMKTRFVSLVSHEIRTPLGVTMSAVELLRNYRHRLAPEKQEELFEDIHGATMRMAGLMEQMLLLGRVEAGKLLYRPAALSLELLAAKLVDEAGSTLGEKCPMELRVHGDLTTAQGDENLLRHILANLLSNAIKYSPPGSPVRLEVRRDGTHAVLEVLDSGIGIPLPDQARLFEAFHRGSNVGETPGTGLGLLIVQRCVEMHSGVLTFESAPGRGTVFRVRLPLFAA